MNSDNNQEIEETTVHFDYNKDEMTLTQSESDETLTVVFKYNKKFYCAANATYEKHNEEKKNPPLVRVQCGGTKSRILDINIKTRIFENLEYTIILENADLEVADSKSYLFTSAEDEYTIKVEKQKNRIIIKLNTKNYVGQLAIPLKYKGTNINLLLTVLSTKLNQVEDLDKICKDLDVDYPFWRFHYLSPTTHYSSTSKEQSYIPLHWYKIFCSLHNVLLQSLELIAEDPHNRLYPNYTLQKVDRIKGRVPPRLAQKIKENIENKIYNKVYKIQRKTRSIDTLENRFIKQMLNSYLKKLDAIKLSTEYEKNNISNLKRPIINFLKTDFMQEVSDFRGTEAESLVLQQKTGYRNAYKTWQMLKKYLKNIEKNNYPLDVGMRSFDKIYEIWCLVQIEECIKEIIRFKSGPKFNIVSRLQKTGDSYKLKEDSLSGNATVEFLYNNYRIRLFREPKISNIFSDSKSRFTTYFHQQKPDIVLLIEEKETDEKYKLCQFIIFDAKYRISPIVLDSSSKQFKFVCDKQRNNTIDGVPNDAIDQMNRYRDAIIVRPTENNETEKYTIITDPHIKRPVTGAFLLFPGHWSEVAKNPYLEAINRVGVGAFALHPTKSNKHLKDFMEKLLEEYVKSDP